MLLAAALLALHHCAQATAASPRPSEPPEIFFLGDSHLSFGAGKVFHDFFRNFEKNCKTEERWMGLSRSIARRRFALMGVKSTAPYHWVSRSRKYKKMVCEPDPKWPVNARLYGFAHRRDGRYVQLGRDPSFPFCRKNQSPLEAVFDWTVPRLMMFYFMGNTIERWAYSPAAARRDIVRLTRQLPDETACIFMTTSPVYYRSHNNLRLRAQENIGAAIDQLGNRCRFVPMITARTISAIEGKRRYFRRHPNGRLKDPYHPGIAAARKLTQLRRPAICRAVLDAMKPGLLAGLK